MIIAGMTWILSYAFVVPTNPDFQYSGRRLSYDAAQCIEGAKEMWRRHYLLNYPDWVKGEFSTACMNKNNHYDFRTITCDKTMNCEVRG
jgi:hypothetical protein